MSPELQTKAPARLMLRVLRFGLLLCTLSTAHPWGAVSSQAFMGDTEGVLGLDGSIRTLFFLLDQDGTYPFSRKNEVDALSQTILRLTALGRPTDSLAYEVHWVQVVTAGSQRISGGQDFSVFTRNVPRYRVFDAGWNVLEKENALSSVFWDRFNVKWAPEWGDITLGRQAITFGKAYFWNPLDVFFPFDAGQFDREYKPGVDALRVDIPLGLFSGINLVGSAGPRLGIGEGASGDNAPEDASWYGSALLGRVFSNVKEWDVAFQGGKIFGGWQVGAGAVGDMGPVQMRGEMAGFWAVQSEDLPFPLEGKLMEDQFTAVLGAGRRFENSFSLDFEYLFNGGGDPDHLNEALVRTQFGSSLQMGRHFLGWLARYEFKPIVTGQCAVIHSLSDGSAQVQPILFISLSDEMDLLVGSTLTFGEAPGNAESSFPKIQSEFGTFPNSIFFEWKFYF